MTAVAVTAATAPKPEKKKRPWVATCGLWLFDSSLQHVALAVAPSGALGPLKGKPEFEDQRSRRATAVRESREESGIEASEYRVLPGCEFHQLNDKGNLSVICFAALFNGADGDELDCAVWMEVEKAMQNGPGQLAPSRQEILTDDWKHVQAQTKRDLAKCTLGSEWVIQKEADDPAGAIVHQAGGDHGDSPAAAVGAARNRT